MKYSMEQAEAFKEHYKAFFDELLMVLSELEHNGDRDGVLFVSEVVAAMIGDAIVKTRPGCDPSLTANFN